MTLRAGVIVCQCQSSVAGELPASSFCISVNCWIGPAHASFTIIAVVITGNHYWTDGIVGSLIVLFALWVSHWWLPKDRVDFAP